MVNRKRHQPFSWHLRASAVVILFLLCGCGGQQTASPDYIAEVRAWQQERISSLLAEDGWLNLAGMYWLEDGENTFGSSPANSLVFPGEETPAFMGAIYLEAGTVRLKVAPGIEVTAQDSLVTEMVIYEPDKEPVRLQHGSLQWFVIERDSLLGIRLRDFAHPRLQTFAGIETYPIDPAWRCKAILVQQQPPKKIDVPTVLNTIRRLESPGILQFECDGENYALNSISQTDDGELFIIFADETTGKETYGGGRFLYTPPPDEEGKIYIDFNKAYNPPCAFTPFSTCPLPPAGNRLPVAVRAGEKNYHNLSQSSAL